MAVAPVSCNYTSNALAFRGRGPKLVDVIEHKDFEERKYETEATTGKKWGVGIASFLVTGLGQAINGDWGKAAAFFFGTIAGCAVLEKLVGRTAATFLAFGAAIESAIDAVNNAKSIKTEIISKADKKTNSV